MKKLSVAAMIVAALVGGGVAHAQMAQSPHGGHGTHGAPAGRAPAAPAMPADMERMGQMMRNMTGMIDRMRSASPEQRAAMMRDMMPMMRDMMPMMHGMMTGTSQAPGGHQHGAAPDANAPASTRAFQEANARMHKDMDIAFTGNADVDFARGMIPHHQGAIDMARIVLEHGRDAEVRKLAEDIIKAQEAEISQLRAIVGRLAR